MLIHQNLGASFCAPKISYQSQKQPVLPPGFQIFWINCRSSDSLILNLLRLLKGLELLELEPLIYPRLFGRVWHAGLLHTLKSYGNFGQIFGVILSFLSRQLQVVLHGNSSQKYSVYVLGFCKFHSWSTTFPIIH